MVNNTLMLLAAFILFSKLLTDFFYKINLPPVLGMILIGLIIGPTGFNFIAQGTDDYFKLKFFADIGVTILLFMAGLETDLAQMKKVGRNAFLVALAGVFIPLSLGFGVTYIFYSNPVVSIVMGIILTATSVSITVMTLMDLKKLKTIEGNIILGAAIIDDVLGILILTFVFGFLGKGQMPVFAGLMVIVAYIVGAGLLGVFVFPLILNFANKLKAEMPVVSIALALLFFFAWAAQKAEIAAITGAYLAGLFMGQTVFKHRISEGVSMVGHTIFISIFFIFIGVETNLRVAEINYPFTALIIVAAISGKLLGAGFSARSLGFGWRRAFGIGSGMIPRGEVALVIASIAMEGLKDRGFTETHFSAVVVMVAVTALIAPFLLKYFFREEKKGG